MKTKEDIQRVMGSGPASATYQLTLGDSFNLWSFNPLTVKYEEIKWAPT